jgi:hypothetical protein
MWRREPVLIGLAGLDAAVVAVLSALMALDVISITGEQLAAVSAAVVAVTSLVGAVLRANVVSPETYETDVVEALMTPAPDVRPELRGYLGGDV